MLIQKQNTVICKSNANKFIQISFFVLVNVRAKLHVKFRKIFCKKFHCETIFRAPDISLGVHSFVSLTVRVNCT